jgi:hypothetical protein
MEMGLLGYGVIAKKPGHGRSNDDSSLFRPLLCMLTTLFRTNKCVWAHK